MSKSIAIFDLDGTLTTSDSFLAFLLSFGRRKRRVGALARTPFRIAKYLAKLTHDYQLKEALLRDYVAGIDREIIDEHVDWFVANWLPRKLHPVGNGLLSEHQSRGDRIILLSASPELAVPKIGEQLGIHEVVCTRLETSGDRFTGKISGKNCKGKQKVEAISAYLKSDQAPTDCYAYGDSKSDRHILQWVHHGAWVRKDRFVPLSNDSEYPTISRDR